MRRASCLLVMVVLPWLGCGRSETGSPSPDLSLSEVVSRFESGAAAVSPHAGDCEAVREEAARFVADNRAFFAKARELDGELTETLLARYEKTQQDLRPILEACTPFEGPHLSAVDASTCDTSKCNSDCNDARKAGNCAFSGFACLAGDDTECCWAGACVGSQSHCVVVCRSSCECNVPPGPPPPPR